MRKKPVMNTDATVCLIKDNDAVTTGGFVMFVLPEFILRALFNQPTGVVGSLC